MTDDTLIQRLDLDGGCTKKANEAGPSPRINDIEELTC
jgi:hypothetical protein